MDHSYFKDRISAYHDRDLPPYELQVVEEHLKECAECQALLAEFEKLDRMVAEKSELADDDYWEQSAQKIEKALGIEEKTKVVDVRPKSWSGLGWKIAAVAASLAVITFIGLHKGDILKDQSPPAPVMQSDSPPLDDLEAVEASEEKTEAVTEEAMSPDRTGEADVVERFGAPEQVPEPSVREKAAPPVPSADSDVAIAIEKKGHTEIPPDVSKIKVVSRRDIVSRESVADSEIQKPPTEEMQEVGTALQPRGGEGALSKEKADRSLALTEAVDVGAARAAELPALRQQRDSLMGLYQARYATDTVRQVEQMALTADKRMMAAKPATPDSTVHLFEQQLVDIHYRIAQLTEDKDEKEASIRFLGVYADRTDVPYADRARKYLESIIPADR